MSGGLSFRLFFTRWAPIGAAIALGVACSGDPSDPKACDQDSRPPFVVTVRTEDRQPLPKDLLIVAHYGGGEETYSLKDGQLGSGERIMFCTPSAADDSGLGGNGGEGGAPSEAGGAHGGGPVKELICKLWDSPVTMGMTASGYEFEDQELKLKQDECGVVTTDVDAVLQRPSFKE